MKKTQYSNEFKRECVELFQTMSFREVYEQKKDELGNVNANSFRSHLNRWKKKIDIDGEILENANLEYNRNVGKITTQYDGSGNVVQYWARTTPLEIDGTSIVKKIIENQKPIDNIELFKGETDNRLLEIPFDDMHFGIAFFEDYEHVLNQTVEVIRSRKWESILVPFGADLLHCDNFNGETGNGTYLGEIDYARMWNDAIKFYRIIFNECCQNSKEVYCYYTQGNHSPSSSWDMLQLMKVWYPQIKFDDSMGDNNLRKVFSWHNIFIGLTHGDTSKAGLRDLKELFIEENKMLYAKAKTIEIHCSHFHHEVGSRDVNGCMARRLPTGVTKDKYHKKKGFTMSSERFQIFEYDHNYIKSFHYINRERIE